MHWPSGVKGLRMRIKLLAIAALSFSAVLAVSGPLAGKPIDRGYAAALQPDGRIVVAGRISENLGDESDVGIARLNADGTPDTGFGNGSGKLRLDLSTNWDEAVDLVVQPDGRIAVLVACDPKSGMVSCGRSTGTEKVFADPALEDPQADVPASTLIDARIAELGDWRGDMLARLPK